MLRASPGRWPLIRSLEPSATGTLARTLRIRTGAFDFTTAVLLMADPGLGDEPAIPEVVRWIADELTAVLFEGIAAQIIAEE